MTTLYGIPNCDTVKKARQWLNEHGVAHGFHDFKRQGVPIAELQRWCEALGWEALVNRKGTSWRRLDGAQRARADDLAGALALMQDHSSVIKRPVVEWPNGTVTVGFDARVWSGLLPG